MPQIAVIYGFSSLDELWSVHGKSLADPDLMKAYDALDSGPEPSFEALDTTLLEAAPYSPEIAAVPAGKARIFELRVYHSPTFRQLTALHERFSGPEIGDFPSPRQLSDPLLLDADRTEHPEPHLPDPVREPGRAGKGLDRVCGRPGMGQGAEGVD
jgi:hypothetical protein